jgi:uncharacterized protein
MPISEAQVPTEHATSYLRQLCRHWGHKFPVTFDDHNGRIELPRAICLLRADPNGLRVRVETSEAADELRMREVVAEHLQRFGFREQLVFDWQPGSAESAAPA